MRKCHSQQQKQRGGPSSPSCSSADILPLRHLNTAECGSESPAELEKHEVKPSAVSMMRSVVLFYLCFLLCLCLGVACVVCVSLWNTRWRGGFAWDGSAFQFNWHPVLMTVGLVVLYGYDSSHGPEWTFCRAGFGPEAVCLTALTQLLKCSPSTWMFCGAVLYRVPLTWGQNKLPWKLLHATLMLLALILSVVGLCAVFDFHNANNTPNLYSLHSWIGISAVALFALQWVGGMAGFLLPWTPVSFRKLLKPTHVWFGGTILTLSIAACISGINEKLFFVLKGNTSGSYRQLPPEALLANSLGVMIVAFGLVVLKILSNPNWQRPESRPEDMTYTPLLQEENE